MSLTTKENILIVDDTPDNLILLSALLESQGYQVKRALSGKLALQGIQVTKPDLVLLDVNMPDMNGYEVCQKLKSISETREIPVIFISALNSVLDKVKAFDVGGVDYITKPFQCEEVFARVRNQLTLRELQRQLNEQNTRLHEEICFRQKSEAREREKAQELELILEELKRTQAQLIQSEKMSSIGQMVVNIASEINNPTSFIYGNLPLARQYFQDLTSLIELYKQTYPYATPEIQYLTSEIDLNFLIEDWKKLIDSMQVGAERIQEIVLSFLSLRNFSQLDELELKPVNLNENINNILLSSQHRLNAEGARSSIEVIKDYGQLPLVTCYASPLNQVFMNLLNNAIDALESQPSPRIITISTSVVSSSEQETTDNGQRTTDFVVIRVADNGPGMSEEVLHKIFDPFFTTKPVGSGAGLGLSISYQIVVNRHGGQLRCHSTPGQGTEFVIELPIAPGKCP
ncbi:MAG TPA: response regulator [Coleofasciculaceae cyanobacterium]|jgi:signal transduction histidine kinase